MSKNSRITRSFIAVLAVLMLLMMSACSKIADIEQSQSDAQNTEKTGDIMILYTSDVHCGINDGFGYAGLAEIRNNLEKKGYTTLLVDNGDAIQGETIGMMSKGESIIEIMNALKYDAAIPGNHEFDYSPDQFLKLTEIAEFPYLSCNIRKSGELLLPPYIIKEAAGKKIAFVGVTTPKTLISSSASAFYDENGEMVYDFMQDASGEKLYAAVQKAVDDARAEGADYVYVLGHMGMGGSEDLWTYADVIEHTNGIDVFLDGHSHDEEQVVMKNKDGKDVVRSACGTKLESIGYSHISPDQGIIDTNIWSWSNKESIPELLGIDNEIQEMIDKMNADLAGMTEEVIGTASADLTINDPNEVDSNGNPIRMVRRAETNLGDFATDAYRIRTGADIAILQGGAIRTSVSAGDITYGNLISVFPFNDDILVAELTGQQILDALEWGARLLPAENGGFLQVSGLTYEVDVNIPSGCTADDMGNYTGINGDRRVSNVKVGGEPIDPDKTYTVASTVFLLRKNGDGFAMLKGVNVVQENGLLDNQATIEYIKEDLGGETGNEYADPYGQGRIVIKQ